MYSSVLNILRLFPSGWSTVNPPSVQQKGARSPWRGYMVFKSASGNILNLIILTDSGM